MTEKHAIVIENLSSLMEEINQLKNMFTTSMREKVISIMEHFCISLIALVTIYKAQEVHITVYSRETRHLGLKLNRNTISRKLTNTANVQAFLLNPGWTDTGHT